MANLVVTAANVKWVSGTQPRVVKAGATITRGQVVYLDTTDNEHKLADADNDNTSVFAGIALTDGYDGSDMLIAPAGATVQIGATPVSGTVYVIGTTPGAIMPWADIVAADWVTVCFIGVASGNVELIGSRGATVSA